MIRVGVALTSILTVLFTVGSNAENEKKCSTVNGIQGACDLTFDQFAFAGTHNSGAGSSGTPLRLKFSAGVLSSLVTKTLYAPSCHWRQQYKSITTQLEDGIRYFDFDVGLNSPEDEEKYGSYFKPGVVLVHGMDVPGIALTAFGTSFLDAMKEIDLFMERNEDALVVVRVKDVMRPREIKAVLKAEIDSYFNGTPRQSKVKLSSTKTPPSLGAAIENNERLFLFVNHNIFPGTNPPTNDTGFLKLHQIETQPSWGDSPFCDLKHSVLEKLKESKRMKNKEYSVHIDWYVKPTLCHTNANYCKGTMEDIPGMNEEIVKLYDRSLNLVMINDVEPGEGNALQELATAIQTINEGNVKRFIHGHTLSGDPTPVSDTRRTFPCTWSPGWLFDALIGCP